MPLAESGPGLPGLLGLWTRGLFTRPLCVCLRNGHMAGLVLGGVAGTGCGGVGPPVSASCSLAAPAGRGGGGGSAPACPNSKPQPPSCRPISSRTRGLCGHRSSPHLANRRWHGGIRRQRGWPGRATPTNGWTLSLQSSTQEIGEELVNGVVYSISLRKVQVHHGATKGQRWLGVSADAGRESAVPRTPGDSLPGFPA